MHILVPEMRFNKKNVCSISMIVVVIAAALTEYFIFLQGYESARHLVSDDNYTNFKVIQL